MVAPLLDSRGVIRYFIGAQVDVSGLCKDCTDLHGLQKLLENREKAQKSNENGDEEDPETKKDEFQQLSEMLSPPELDTVRKYGGNMHREHADEPDDGVKRGDRPRLLLKEPSGDRHKNHAPGLRANGRLEGIYQNVCLFIPHIFSNF